LASKRLAVDAESADSTIYLEVWDMEVVEGGGGGGDYAIVILIIIALNHLRLL